MGRGLISPETKEEIRQRIGLVDLVSVHVSLKKAGRYYKGLCPFHQEKTPSFHVDPERGLFHCFGCGVGGDAFDFLMRTANMTFTEAVHELARRAGVEIDTTPGAAARSSEREALHRVLDAARAHYQEMLARRGGRAKEYMSRRGLDDEAAARFGLGFAPPGWDGLLAALGAKRYPAELLEQAGLAVARPGGGHYDVFRDRLIFPIVDLHDRTVAFGGRTLGDDQPTYLNSRESPVFTKGRMLYALSLARDAIRECGEALVVEGYMDAITCHQFGFRNAVASLGTALTSDQIALLRRFAPRVVLVYDADAAGEAAAERGLALCEEAELAARAAVLPAGEDPDGLIRRYGPEALDRTVRAAVPMFEYRIAQAEKRHNPDSREGKLALVDELLSVVRATINPVRAAEYVRVLAERFDLPEEALRQRLRARGRRGRPPAGEGVTVAPAGDRAREEAERLLVHLMVHEPSRREAVAEGLTADSFGNPTHRALAAALLGGHAAGIGELREELDEDAAALLTRLAFEPPPAAERDRERAAAEALRYLSQVQPAAVERERVWEELKAAQARGDEAEVRRLQAQYAALIANGRRLR